MGQLDGNAIVYCEGAFNTTNGKTAHGLVRFTRRYRVLSVVDSRYAGQDAGSVLDGKANGIPVTTSIEEAVVFAQSSGHPATHLVVGLAPDGGRLSAKARADIQSAISRKLNIVCGLHDYLSDDPKMVELAKTHSVTLSDIRKPPPVEDLHFFTSKIEQVDSFKVAVLGVDSAVGKRTTAWKVMDGLIEKGRSAELVGTGQTAWLQGVRYGLLLDSIINDFLTGEIEHSVWTAWNEQHPDFLILEGQGSLLNPAYPGGYELIAAARPDALILQHVPMRKEYDGFPCYKIQDLGKQIAAIEMISDKKVIAIAVNHENIPPDRIGEVCKSIEQESGLPTADVLTQGAGKIVKAVIEAEGKWKRR
jgi:uncharacterized NAD-dependent epimerase/dehydratase family protein